MVAVSLKKKIRKEISGSKSPFYYLAIPPSLFDNAVKHLENSGCAKDGRIAADFFKQKTAYGILGCDWSSDVCSSDLVANYSLSGVIAADSALVTLDSSSALDRKSVV